MKATSAGPCLRAKASWLSAMRLPRAASPLGSLGLRTAPRGSVATGLVRAASVSAAARAIQLNQLGIRRVGRLQHRAVDGAGLQHMAGGVELEMAFGDPATVAAGLHDEGGR